MVWLYLESLYIEFLILRRLFLNYFRTFFFISQEHFDYQQSENKRVDGIRDLKSLHPSPGFHLENCPMQVFIKDFEIREGVTQKFGIHIVGIYST